MISTMFYIIASYVFYENILNYLYYRPTLLEAVLEQRFTLTEIEFFINENELLGTNLTLNSVYPSFNALDDPIDQLNEIYQNIYLTSLIINDPNSAKLMSSSVINTIFNTVQNSSSFLYEGTYAGYNNLNQKSHMIVFNDFSDSATTLVAFYNQSNILGSFLKYIAITVDSDSSNLINDQLNLFIDFIVFCCLFLMLMYLFYYKPYLDSEKKTLKRLTRFINMLPSSQNLNKTKAP